MTTEINSESPTPPEPQAPALALDHGSGVMQEVQHLRAALWVIANTSKELPTLEHARKALEDSCGPEGWVLVPLTPTPAMIEAAGMGWVITPANLRKRLLVYSAMVRAAVFPNTSMTK